MGFKGTSVIELTDVHTGEKETYENSNIVTAAVPKVLGMHLGLLEKRYQTLSPLVTLLPPVPNAIGGILCFENPLTEDTAVLYADMDNKVVGCSGNGSHTTASTIRGSMNVLESGPLSDGKGYRFLFDFATSQGNGTISALALTSKLGGISGFGDTVSPFSCVLSGSDSVFSTSSSEYEPYIRVITAVYYMVGVRPDKNDIIAIIPLATGELEIVSIPFPTTKVDLTGGYWQNQDSYRTLATITPSLSFFNGSASYSQTSYFYGSFFDGGDGYWWGFSWRSSSSATTGNIYWIKINQETYETEEGTWTLNNVSLPNPAGMSFSDAIDASYWYNTSKHLRPFCYATLGGGYLYIMRYNRTQVYKINLSQPTDITTIDVTTVSDLTNELSYAPKSYLNYIHGRVYLPTGWIEPDGTFVEVAIDWADIGTLFPVTRKDQVYAFSCGHYGTYTKMWPHLITPYLATINNLDNPVQKTADKTMKIIYILREEDA